MKEVAIVVVTYNRCVLLEKCINKLLEQKYKNFEILIIDNKSTDETSEMVKKYTQKENVNYYNTGKNLGGAGGFNYGIKQAIKTTNADYIWLMDDDCIVNQDSLSELIKADEILNGNYGFLSSIVEWTDSTVCEMNKQKIKKPWYSKAKYLQHGLLPTYYATFVSFFIKRDVIKDVGLPIKDFFIWGDDVEYSDRISKKYDCYIVGKSIVVHETASNAGSNIAKDQKERIGRYKYAYRNEMYIAKKNGIKGICRQLCKIVLHIFRVIFKSKNSKLKKIWIILKNSFIGIFFNPKVEYIN